MQGITTVYIMQSSTGCICET